MKYLNLFCLIIGLTVFGAEMKLIYGPSRSSDAYARQHVVQFHSEAGSCTGEQVTAKSGKTYVLTAGHCAGIMKQPKAVITDYRGRSYPAHIVAEDTCSDLLLLSGVPGLKGLDTAKDVSEQEHLRTFTHGGGYKTYKTEGEWVQRVKIAIPMFELSAPEDRARCNMPKYKVQDITGIFGESFSVCAMVTTDMAVTAAVIPGSSGGPLFNDAGELVGVVSGGSPSQPMFGFFVDLKDVQRFLKRF